MIRLLVWLFKRFNMTDRLRDYNDRKNRSSERRDRLSINERVTIYHNNLTLPSDVSKPDNHL